MEQAPTDRARRRSPFAWALILLAASAPGCLPLSAPGLVIATTWPEAECRPLAEAFARRVGDPVPIAWVRLAPGRGPAEAIAHGARVDVVLGGPPSTYRRLAGLGDLEPPDPGGAPSWCLVRHRQDVEHPASAPGADDDPRTAPVILFLMKSRLSAAKTWADGYAELVRSAGADRPGSAPAVVEWDEGAGIAPGAPHPEAARAFLALLAERAPRPSEGAESDPSADALLADLLGATLVDARDELRAADAAVERAGRPARWVAWMTQAPPWPPAFVTSRLIARRKANGEDPGPWIDTWARQVAPDPAARAWLLASWDRPERPLDAALLTELAGAAGGTLAREPRFRAWLRGEWREWARQRYRRVARGAAGAWP